MTVRCHVSGTALAAGNAANPRPVASAIPLTYFSNDAKIQERRPKQVRAVPAGILALAVDFEVPEQRGRVPAYWSEIWNLKSKI